MDIILNDCIELIKKNDYDTCISLLFNNIDSVHNIFKHIQLKMIKKNIQVNDIIKENQPHYKLYFIIIICLNNICKDMQTIDISKEVSNYKKQIFYRIIFCDNATLLKLFILFTIICKHVKQSKKKYVGIDCEYRKLKVALMQMCYEIIIEKNIRYVWIIDPNELDQMMMNEFIKNIMINNKIYKIFQGSESRDMMYIFPTMLQSNTQLIIKFIRKVIDTRFMCEYYKACKGETDIRSSLYESYLYFGVITEDKYKELYNIEYGMGPHQDIVWDIHRLAQDLKRYAFYDVLYLKYLVKAMYKKIRTEFPEYTNSLNYVNKISRFTLGESENFQIMKIREYVDKIVNPLNINYIRYRNENVKLDDISKMVIADIIIPLPNNTQYGLPLNNVLKVIYFKKWLRMIFKLIIYSIISKRYTIYKNKRDTYDDKIILDKFYSDIRKTYGKTLMDLLKSFEKNAENKILTTYKIE